MMRSVPDRRSTWKHADHWIQSEYGGDAGELYDLQRRRLASLDLRQPWT